MYVLLKIGILNVMLVFGGVQFTIVALPMKVIFPSSCGVIEETSMEIAGIHHIVLSLYKLSNERNCSPSTFEIFKCFMAMATCQTFGVSFFTTLIADKYVFACFFGDLI